MIIDLEARCLEWIEYRDTRTCLDHDSKYPSKPDGQKVLLLQKVWQLIQVAKHKTGYCLRLVSVLERRARDRNCVGHVVYVIALSTHSQDRSVR